MQVEWKLEKKQERAANKSKIEEVRGREKFMKRNHPIVAAAGRRSSRPSCQEVQNTQRCAWNC